MDESDLIRDIFTGLGATRGDVLRGVGDDAAVVRPPCGRDLALSTDSLVAEVHFPMDLPAAAVGHRALAVNLSDLAAMGAEPSWALLALTLPEVDREWIRLFASGYARLARTHGVALVGGNLAQGPLTITVTVAGFLAPGAALTRDGAREGDDLYVTGVVGGGTAGLRAFRAGNAVTDPTVRPYALPEPRLRAGEALIAHAHAAIDLSDGLVGDLAKLLEASGGLGAEINPRRLPLAPGASLDDGLGPSDDYELLLTASVDAAAELAALQPDAALGCPLTRIGRVTAESGIRLGSRTLMPGRFGYRHFS